MRIRKDTWHYRIWYFTHCLHFKPSGQTNLFRYVSRIILMPIPVCIVLGSVMLLAIVSLILLLVVGNVLMILSGTGFLFPPFDKKEIIKRFPPITFGTWQIPLPYVVLSSYSLLIIAASIYFSPWTTLTYVGYGAGGLGALVLLYVIVASIFHVGRWDVWLLFKAYLKAKKQKLYPLVT